MRTRNPFTLLQDYLTSSDARIRRNAATALAAIGSEESISGLVGLALNDPDHEVREHAEKELAQLEGPAAEHLTRILQSEMDDNPRGLRRGEIAVLVDRLRLRGWSVAAARPGFFSRLGIAGSIRRLSEVKDRRRRKVVVAAAGGLCGALLMTAYLVGSLPGAAAPRFLILLILLVPAAAALIGFVATRLAGPIDLHDDRVAASLFEVAAAGALTFGLGLAVAFLALIVVPSPPWELLLAVPPAAGLLAAAVRAGTIASFGAWGDARRGFVMQTLAGSAAGALAGTAMLLFVRANAGATPADTASASGPLVAELLWLFMIPVGVGVAAAFAAIDRGAVQTGLFRSGIARLLGVGLAIVPLVLLIGRVGSAVATALREEPVLVAESGKPRPEVLPIPSFPYSRRIAAGFAQQLVAQFEGAAPQPSAPAAIEDVIVNLYGFRPFGVDRTGAPNCVDGSPSPVLLPANGESAHGISQAVGWGCYVVEVSDRAMADRTLGFVESVVAVAADRVEQPDRSNVSESSPGNRLTLTLNAMADQASTADALSGDGPSTVVVNSSSSLDLVLKDARTVRAEIHPPSSLLPPRSTNSADGAVRASRVQLELLDRQGTGRPAEDRYFGKRVAPARVIEASLRAGSYTLSVKPEGETELAYTVQVTTTPILAAPGTWPLDTVPATRHFTLASPQRIRATVEAGPASSFLDVVLELFRRDVMEPTGERLVAREDDPERIDTMLEPGEYRLQVIPFGYAQTSSTAGDLNLTYASGLSLAFEFPAPLVNFAASGGVPTAAPGRRLEGYWTVATVPVDRTFVVDGFAQRIEAEIQAENADQDLVLELLRDGVVIDSGDTPEQIATELEPGRYVLRARLYLSETGRAAVSNTRLRLDLNTDRRQP